MKQSFISKIKSEQEASVISKNKSIIEQKQAEIQNYKNIKKQISVRVNKLFFLNVLIINLD